MKPLAALVAIACTVGLGRADVGKPIGTPAPKPISNIAIGAYLSMTGPLATFGVSTNEGIQLAIEQHNARTTGRKLAVDVLDTQGKAGDAAAAVSRFADQGVVALVGEVASSVTLAGGQVAQKRGIPMITPAATNPAVTQVGNMISRVCVVDELQARAMAKFVREQLKLSKVAILVDQAQAYSSGLGEQFARAFGQLGGVIGFTQKYNGGASDYEPQLKAIAAAKVQAIYVPGYYSDVGQIAKQARALGITIPMLGGDGWDSDDLAKLAGTAIDGSYFTTHFIASDPRPTTKAFVAAFQAKYKHDPDTLAALGYDAANVLAAAIGRANSHNGADVTAAIRSTKNHDGVTGTITIDPKTGDAKKPVVVVKIAGGKPTHAATLAP